MQNISLHIEYLLRTHDCVILPGIGAFLRTYRAAVCDSDGTLLPPSLQICFNSSIISGDGLLCHSVARRARISHEEAAVLVSNAAEECRNALNKDGEFAVGKLGLLLQDEEQCISFQPYKSIYDNIWKRIAPASARENETTTNIVSPESVDKTDSKYYIIKISRRAVRYAAMAAICLLTAATLLLPSANRFGNPGIITDKQYASVVPGIQNITTETKATDTENPSDISDSTDMLQVITEGDADESLVMSEVNDAKFYLIVATFSKEEDCQKFISTQPDSDQLDIVSSGKVSRVYSSCSDNKDELLKELNSAERKALHPQAWIWEKP